MYKKHYAYGTVAHTFTFDPELYEWTYEIGKSNLLETLYQIARDAAYCVNWSVFDWNRGKNGYGKIQNGNIILQSASKDFPTVSMVEGILKNGDYPVAYPGFARWRGLVEDGKVNITYVVPGNFAVKDARSAIGQLANGNIVFITVEGDDTKNKGMTCRELAQFAVSLGCRFACDCDGGGSVACLTKDGYIYNQGRAIAGAMVLRCKSFTSMIKSKVGCGYVLMTQGEILTKELLKHCIDVNGAQHYYFDGYSAEKWLGKQVFDCSGLVVWALKKMGLLSTRPNAEQIYTTMCNPVPMSDIKEGDLCFNDNLSHMGVYLGNGEYIQAKGTKDGVVITDKYSFTKFGRLKLLNNGGCGDMPTSEEKKNELAVAFVRKFQASFGLVIDGISGNLTNTKLDDIITNEKELARFIKLIK